MVGIVIVSHSRELARALRELVKQITGQNVPLAIAAGVGPDRGEFGTDAIEVVEAIQSVYSPDGVLVLMDLGSAVLSAEMALEFLPDEMRSSVRFCAAPFVEGAIAAGVQAGLGSDLDTVCREALSALGPKSTQLGEIVEPGPEGPEAAISGDGQKEIQLTLRNAHGLHARPAARFVQTAARFTATIQVRNATKERGPVSARSLNALASLAAVYGDQITIIAAGPQSGEAVEALAELVHANFGEPGPEEVVTPPDAAGTTPAGDGVIPVSAGVAVGPLYVFKPSLPPVPDHPAESPDADWDRLSEALRKTAREIKDRRRKVALDLGEDQAAIFDAHLLILEDPELLQQVKSLIFTEKRNAAASWKQAIDEVAETYRSLEDPYLQQRASDVLDIGEQVLQILSGSGPSERFILPEPAILLAADLTPTQTVQLDLDRILGLITVRGGPTSHSAILARSMGIPALAGGDPAMEAMPNGTLVALDGSTGELIVNPSEEEVALFQERRSEWLAHKQRMRELSHQPTATRDGHAIQVAANVGSVKDARLARQNGAEGIGLLRTEFLFLMRRSPPSEQEQQQSLQEILEAIGDHPVIVRTLDAGGDKELPYLSLPEEDNPFLGVRAIRLSLREVDLFRTQLRAILQAGKHARVKIMFPMVARFEELQSARQILADVHQELQQTNTEHLWPIETGIMIETPASALISPVLAPHVDFFSIGTNDLTQYTLAAERGNAALAELSDAMHPSVLNLIKMVAQAAHEHGKWVGVCGELASEVEAVPVLIGLGVDELSMNAAMVPEIKQVVRRINLKGARALAEEACRVSGAGEARKLARQFLQELPA